MAFIELYKDKLKHNYQFLDTLLKKNGKEWAVVSKLLCGNKIYIKELIDLGAREICDSRVSNLKVVKQINPNVETVYIKPPAKRSIKNIVKYADASFNTEFETIKLLSEEALKQGKIHRVIIMIEMGDLREGVMGDDLLDFYEQIFKLKGIQVTGIGTNLNCLNGVLPSHDKLIQLSLYEQLIETKFNRKIPWVTGGTSITLPMLKKNQIPKGINHFRIGETLFFGNDLLENIPFKGMRQDVIKLFAEIIEITEKPKVPVGELAENPSGDLFEVDDSDYGEMSYRAIIDIGLLDITTDFLIPEDGQISIIGASSDMLILDLGKSYKKYKVGDLISFRLKYMGALSLFNSDYIEKRLV
ncbi:alanine/ornithine racemase family PLP-dependent enzyme [Vicingus serpentipes]|uniref:Alanine/ornithine racemase family PLP-dependent enzyme n=1 Tax=Vicingus serpentipes TaxID=1926625 RepID=A0A5C6S0H9_9FLAO|nr:alanine/ornithine racemase family PLP-dependent enzyme [Vicingus serpentipes]TXB67112.1 alanine/ornithine racemase family PLP-dependent enzyme [Vicingus serpentipes]